MAGAPLKLTADKANHIITGSGAADEFGFALLAADLNNDAKTDLAVSAPGAQNGKGVVYVYLQETLAKRDSRAEILDYKFSGSGQEGARFGAALTTLDIDRDGTQDLVISEPSYDTPLNSDAGRVYLFLQNQIPWTSGEEPCLRNCSAASVDATLEGESAGNLFGTSLASGEFTNDSFSDLAVSAPGFGIIEGAPKGRAYVFSNSRLQIADCARLPVGQGLQIADCRLQIADFNSNQESGIGGVGFEGG